MNDTYEFSIATEALMNMEKHLRVIALNIDKLISGAQQKAFEDGKRAGRASAPGLDETDKPIPKRRCDSCGEVFQPHKAWSRTCLPCWRAGQDAKRSGARTTPATPPQEPPVAEDEIPF